MNIEKVWFWADDYILSPLLGAWDRWVVWPFKEWVVEPIMDRVITPAATFWRRRVVWPLEDLYVTHLWARVVAQAALVLLFIGFAALFVVARVPGMAAVGALIDKFWLGDQLGASHEFIGVLLAAAVAILWIALAGMLETARYMSGLTRKIILVSFTSVATAFFGFCATFLVDWSYRLDGGIILSTMTGLALALTIILIYMPAASFKTKRRYY